VSEDGNKLLVCDWQSNGKLVLLQTKPLQVLKEFGGGATGLFKFPHGIIANESFDTFRVTSQYGNFIYKFTADENLYTKISLDGKPLSNNPGTLDPHELYYTPDKSKYFITCEASNEVRIFDAKKDTLIKTISLGIFPQEIAMSKTKPYAFITCSEDVSSFPGFKGSVYVINYNTLTITKRIDAPFYQPHGINVDDQHAIFYVYSRNVNPSGPAPHHSSSCAGRNGYYQVFDLNALNLKTNKRFETIVDPYSADTRFK
jgi:DNA-binding beta-propeller fold protein YncE